MPQAATARRSAAGIGSMSYVMGSHVGTAMERGRVRAPISPSSAARRRRRVGREITRFAARMEIFVLMIRLGSVVNRARLRVRRGSAVRERGLMRMDIVVRQRRFRRDMGARRKVLSGLLGGYAPLESRAMLKFSYTRLRRK